MGVLSTFDLNPLKLESPIDTEFICTLGFDISEFNTTLDVFVVDIVVTLGAVVVTFVVTLLRAVVTLLLFLCVGVTLVVVVTLLVEEVILWGISFMLLLFWLKNKYSYVESEFIESRLGNDDFLTFS